MNNLKKYLPTFSLLLIYFGINFLFASSAFIRAFIICTAVFYTGIIDSRLKRKQWLILFGIASIILIKTLKSSLIFWCILLFSYLIWNTITPYIAKYKRSLTLSFALSISVILLACLAKISFPLFSLVFYPLYLFGHLIKKYRTDNLRREGLTISLKLIMAASAFTVLYLSIKKTAYLNNLLFMKLTVTGTEVAMQFPLIMLLFLVLALEFNAFFYFLYRIFIIKEEDDYEKSPVSIDYAKTDFASIVIILAITAILYLSSQWLMSDGNLLPIFQSLLTPMAIFNVLILFSVYFILFTLIGRVWSTILITVLALSLQLANFIKLTYFGEPFYPWDMYMVKNAIMIGGHYITPTVVIILVFVSAVITYCVLLSQGRIRQKFKLKPLFPLLPFAVVILASNYYILSSTNILKELNITKSWYIGKEEMITNGFFAQNAMYLKDLKEYLPSAPKDYSKNSLENIMDGLSTQNVKAYTTINSKRPNIVVIMNESFWDPTRLGVTFNIDITNTIRTYSSGNIISPVFGAKTANTEFEVLTGMSMYFMEPSIIPYNLYLRRPTPSVVSTLRDCGYETIAIHPNDGSFYNRKTVYENIGFDKFIDVSGFTTGNGAEGYSVTDDSVVNKILEQLNTESGKPKFIFALTIQNHDPYYNKYSQAQVQVETDKLDATEKRVLNNYAQGVYSGDSALRRIIDTLNSSKTPTNLYFFGDHLPRLGSPNPISDIYEKFNYVDNFTTIYKNIKMYTVPLVAWSNYQQLKKHDSPISPAQLGYEILIDANVPYPVYFNILRDLSATHPVLQNLIDNNNALIDETIQKYQMIQYDLLFGNQYLNEFK